jgi:hypothetical protein
MHELLLLLFPLLRLPGGGLLFASVSIQLRSEIISEDVDVIFEPHIH